MQWLAVSVFFLVKASREMCNSRGISDTHLVILAICSRKERSLPGTVPGGSNRCHRRAALDAMAKDVSAKLRFFWERKIAQRKRIGGKVQGIMAGAPPNFLPVSGTLRMGERRGDVTLDSAVNAVDQLQHTRTTRHSSAGVRSGCYTGIVSFLLKMTA